MGGASSRKSHHIAFICSFFFFFAHFYFPASGQAVVTGVIPSPPRFLPSIFMAHRVQQSHCSSFFIECLLTHALALSASQFVRKKKSPRIYTSMHSGEFELTKLTYTRLEDNLIRHRGDRLQPPRSCTYVQGFLDFARKFNNDLCIIWRLPMYRSAQNDGCAAQTNHRPDPNPNPNPTLWGAEGMLSRSAGAVLRLRANPKTLHVRAIKRLVGPNLNYDEVAVYSEDAALPTYLIVYTTA
eukprot:jgi/Undpi1/13751/HiC_scaffold_9.g03404.m1